MKFSIYFTEEACFRNDLLPNVLFVKLFFISDAFFTCVPFFSMWCVCGSYRWSVLYRVYRFLFLWWLGTVVISKTRLFKYIENFSTKKWKFSDKNCNCFHIFAPNIDYGYSLEPPRRGGSNEYPQSMFLSRSKKNKGHPCKPQFYYIKV